MEYWIDRLNDIEGYSKAVKELRKKDGTRKRVSITGPADSQKLHLCYALCRHLKARGIFLTFNEIQARRAFEDLSVFFGSGVIHFPFREAVLHNIEAKSKDTEYERIKALQRIIEGNYELIVASVEALALPLPPPGAMTENTVEIRNGGAIELYKMTLKLASMGYERIDRVEGRGQFAVRGGILDIFPVDEENPVRVELFGDEVDSLRYFDADSQRSVGIVDKITVPPAVELPYSHIDSKKLSEILISQMELQYERLKKVDTAAAENIRQRVEHDTERLLGGIHFSGIDRYIPQILTKPATILDYTSEKVLVFIDERAHLKERMENLKLEHYETCKTLLEKGSLLPESSATYLEFESIENSLDKAGTILLNALSPDREVDSVKCPIVSKSLNSYQGHVELMMNDLAEWRKNGYSTVIFAGTRSRGEKLADALRRQGLEAYLKAEADVSGSRAAGGSGVAEGSGVVGSSGVAAETGSITIVPGSLARGFEYPEIKLVMLSETGIFMTGRKRTRRKDKAAGKSMDLFTELSPGDYVVHRVHGIGLYTGIEQLTVEGNKRDYLKIRYKDGDNLYIPGTQLELMQKYIGAEGKAPKLSKLGGADWNRTKSKVSESLKKLAFGLVELYAKRQAVKGYAFSPDTVWQKQFEDLFPYEETEDQLKSIEEIKADMEAAKPVDRLLCGDVGYGKTEVAIRAAFKAVMDGKQVAYLVPTTVLAQQHYNTFKERMKDFPVTVEMLSRFRTPTQQKKIVKDVKNGMIDILIGTHRILQKDIQFKDLGLLVVDEEHRFGVTHKEKMKNLRPDVDVLTLTATPIPRTLHMSLIGARDISVIEQPPEERYPVQTFVMEYNDDVVRDAINRELARGGQVFYLSNRVRTIDLKAAKVAQLCPDAKIGVAHGQMGERELEDVMMGFIKGDFDVLVCTSIIESGLDMPNANTIIVENADYLGLAQLYQIRGRVGRSNRLAYAYITYKRDKVLPEAAEKRLQAIKEFTEFGSGFKIAMRDLEIRGAGNILGPEQHGHIATVGYDMYCRLLEKAVRELKGEPEVPAETEITIDLDVSAYLDEGYISNEGLKIEMYKKIAAIEDEEDVLDIRDELTDRYGDIPKAANNLIEIAYIKAVAKELGIISVAQKNETITFGLQAVTPAMIKSISELSATKYKRRILLNAGSKPYFALKVPRSENNQTPENIKILLQDIKNGEAK